MWLTLYLKLFINRLYKALFDLTDKECVLYMKRAGVILQDGMICAGKPVIRKAKDSVISIGRRCKMHNTLESNIAGVVHPTVLATMQPGSEIIIGDDAGLSGAIIVARTKVTLGNNVSVGANCTIVDNDFHSINYADRICHSTKNAISKPVLIDDNVWLGMNVIVLKGVTIGKRTVVAANSVVTKSLPSDVIAAGNPAKIIRKIE